MAAAGSRPWRASCAGSSSERRTSRGRARAHRPARAAEHAAFPSMGRRMAASARPRGERECRSGRSDSIRPALPGASSARFAAAAPRRRSRGGCERTREAVGPTLALVRHTLARLACSRSRYVWRVRQARVRALRRRATARRLRHPAGDDQARAASRIAARVVRSAPPNGHPCAATARCAGTEAIGGLHARAHDVPHAAAEHGLLFELVRLPEVGVIPRHRARRCLPCETSNERRRHGG